LDTIGEGSLDLIIANSLLQYLQHREFEELLEIWHRQLKPDARIVIADVLPPDVDATADVKALLDFAWRGGFLIAALGGLGRTFFSDYRRLRNEVGLTRYAPEDLFTLLSAHGFTGEQTPSNIGHNQLRMAFIARKT
jgi:SAM-dependent methyltransferase